MQLRLPLLSAALLLAACNSHTAPVDHGEHGGMDGASTVVADRLNASPRHQEWVNVIRGDKTIRTWVVYPESSEPAPVVILIHENRGLNDWARGMADQVAEAGFIAVAPDLLSDFSTEFSQTSDFPDEDAARTALSQLTPEGVTADLQAVAAWAKTIPASNGKLVSAGFCWGGSRSFDFATANPELAAVLVFYGTGPTDAAAYASIEAPVFGFYGGADERVNATIDATAQAMSSARKSFDYEIYDGAGHAFMRSGEDAAGDPNNVAARKAAWERMRAILSDL